MNIIWRYWRAWCIERVHARFGGGKSKKDQERQLVGFLSYNVHCTETCDADTPHLMVEVTPSSATMPDGDSVGELHAQLDEQQILPAQHLRERGSVDAEVRSLEPASLSGGPCWKRRCQRRHGLQKKLGVVITANFSLIGKRTRRPVLPDTRAEMGVLSPTGTDSRAFAFVSPFDAAALVRFMHTVPLVRQTS